jgi:hypothetical protein
MTQRPIVNLIVQDSEVPVGSRTKGPHSRLLVVEGVGDMVLLNGQRIVCLKMRRDPAMGLENVDYSWSDANSWHAPQPSNQASVTDGNAPAANPYTVDGMAPLPEGVRASATAQQGIVDVMTGMPYSNNTYASVNMPEAAVDNIAIELAQGTDIASLEGTWEAIRSKNQRLLKGYNPYFSIDTVAEGGVPELFRLRVGPIKDVKTGDEICANLSKKGITCSVIRTQ